MARGVRSLSSKPELSPRCYLPGLAQVLTQVTNIRGRRSLTAELPYMTILKVPSSTQEYKSRWRRTGKGHRNEIEQRYHSWGWKPEGASPLLEQMTPEGTRYSWGKHPGKAKENKTKCIKRHRKEAAMCHYCGSPLHLRRQKGESYTT